MKLTSTTTQSIVFSHWESVEKLNIWQRADIIFPLVAYGDLTWNLAVIEPTDIDKIYICSSDDWMAEGLCNPDYRLTTAIENYQKSNYSEGKYKNIKSKEEIFINNPNGLDTKLILVAENTSGPYTLIEGCKRAVALGKLDKLVGIQIYLGMSQGIKTYFWARYTK